MPGTGKPATDTNQTKRPCFSKAGILNRTMLIAIALKSKRAFYRICGYMAIFLLSMLFQTANMSLSADMQFF